MNSSNLIQAESKYLVQTYSRPEIVLVRGEGAYVYDSEDRRYLDFTAGIAVNALGHSDPAWVQAIAQQASQLTHVSNLYHTAPQIELAQRLVENSFADRVFFCNSGSEANETAFKFARKWAKSINPEKTNIIAFNQSFHGRTMGALSATYKSKYRDPFAPLIPHVQFAPYNDVAAVQDIIDDKTCAVIVEPIQGEGGIHPATAEFLQALRHLCDEHQAVLIFDEVQCGLGRSGRLWAHETYAITPDIMTLAKPLAGGLPIGATLVTETIAQAIGPGDHGNTFAGGPLICRAANVVFDRIHQPDFLAQVRQNGLYLKHRLQTLESDQVAEVRGQGLMLGLGLNSEAIPLVHAARKKGLLVVNAGADTIRFVPPLIIGQAEIDEAVTILEACLD